MLDSEVLAQKIMAACAEHGYVTARCAEDMFHPCIIGWSETATEHIGAMIEAYAAEARAQARAQEGGR